MRFLACILWRGHKWGPWRLTQSKIGWSRTCTHCGWVAITYAWKG